MTCISEAADMRRPAAAVDSQRLFLSCQAGFAVQICQLMTDLTCISEAADRRRPATAPGILRGCSRNAPTICQKNQLQFLSSSLLLSSLELSDTQSL